MKPFMSRSFLRIETMKINYKQYHMTVLCASLVAGLSILDLVGQDGGEIPKSIKDCLIIA